MKLHIFRDGGYGDYKLARPWYIADVPSGRIAKVRNLALPNEPENLELSINPIAQGESYFRTKRECRAILHKLGIKEYQP